MYSSAPRQESQNQMFRNFLREANRYKGIVSKDKGSDSNHCAQLEDRLVVLVEVSGSYMHVKHHFPIKLVDINRRLWQI